MSTICFESEWLDGTGMEGAELAATFASLRIRVGATAVTKLLDHRTKTFREWIQVPLYQPVEKAPRPPPFDHRTPSPRRVARRGALPTGRRRESLRDSPRRISRGGGHPLPAPLPGRRSAPTSAPRTFSTGCYPVAESLATNWWFFAGGPGSGDADDENSPRRRSLIGNRDGFIYPRLTAVSEARTVRVAWRASVPGDRDAAGRVEFTSEGETLVETGEFRRACSDLIERVLARLSIFEVEDTLLQREWAAICGADAEEAAFCEAAASYGWDPYDLDDEQLQRLENRGVR